MNTALGAHDASDAVFVLGVNMANLTGGPTGPSSPGPPSPSPGPPSGLPGGVGYDKLMSPSAQVMRKLPLEALKQRLVTPMHPQAMSQNMAFLMQHPGFDRFLMTHPQLQGRIEGQDLPTSPEFMGNVPQDIRNNPPNDSEAGQGWAYNSPYSGGAQSWQSQAAQQADTFDPSRGR